MLPRNPVFHVNIYASILWWNGKWFTKYKLLYRMIEIHFCLNRIQLSFIDSILRIPIPSSRNSSISYIPNIIALSIMESQQLLLQATILRIEKMLKVLLQDTGIQRESIYLPNSIIISFPFYMFHYPTISSILLFKLLLNLMTVL